MGRRKFTVKTAMMATTAVASLALSNTQAVAQDAANSESDDLSVIVVTGVRGSLARSLQTKRNAAGVVDGIDSEDMIDFPDLNISESLSRVTGVTINRVLGEGQQVSVRGLAPEFTRVTINGQSVTSGNPGRDVDFDVFASELFSSVQLTKTPSASLTEGGLAATVDLRTARPFDFGKDGTNFAISGQGSYNDKREEWDPRVSALASTTLADGTIGILASVSYSETSLRQDNVEGLRFKLIDVDLEGDGTPEITDAEYPFIPRYLLELFDRERLGLTGALQFHPDDTFELNLDVAFAKFDTVRRRHSIDGLLRDNDFSGISAGLPSVDSTGLITQVTLDNVDSRSENILTPEDEELLLINLDTAWRFAEGWEARAKFGYSDASRVRPEFRSVWQINGEFSYDLSDRIFYGFEQTAADFSNPSDFVANQSRFETFDVDDEEWSLQGDLERNYDDSFISSVALGIRYSDREKSQVEFDDRVTVTSLGIAPAGSIIADFPVNDFFGGRSDSQIVRNWFVPDFDAVMADSTLVPAGFSPGQVFTNSFVIEEQSIGGYLQANFEGNLDSLPVRGNAGVRIVNTDQTSNGFALVAGDPVPITVDNSYTDILPSANLVFEPGDDVLLRVAASKSLTRATLTALQPGGSVQPTGLTASLGDPELDPFSATQLDVSLEWYFADEALASFTFFYKDVDGFITNVTADGMINAGTLINDEGDDVSNEIFAISQPINGDKATIKGFEASIQTPFTFLPAPFDGLGMLANFTYADSASTITFNGEEVTTLLPGQSRSSFNLIGYYEKGAFSTRVAYSWRDEYLREVRPRANERSNFIASYGQLDLNVQYEVTDNIILTFDGLNLLGEAEQEFSETRDRNRRFSEWGRFFIFGARAKF